MNNLSLMNLLCEILSFNNSPETVCLKVNQLLHEDWEKLLKVATKQIASLILYERLRHLDAFTEIPNFVQARLRETYHRSLAKNLRMMHHAGLLLEALSNQQIDVIALKGIYLAEHIYPNIGLRTFFDLDFMVRKEDIPRNLSFMQEIGYVTSTYFNIEEDNLDIKHIPAMVKDDSSYIEMHWGILEEDEPFNIDLQGIWERAKKVKISGTEVLTLGYEDLVLHLCIHFTYQHNMEIGLGYLYDIALIIENHREQIEWNELIRIAKSWGVEKIIWLTLCMLSRLLNVAVPTSVLENLLQQNDNQLIVDAAINHFMMNANTKERINITPDLVHLSSSKGLFRKIKLISQRIFIPKYILARAYNISPKSFKIYIYYFVRCAELLSNYAPTIVKITRKDEDALASVEDEFIKERLLNWYTN